MVAGSSRGGRRELMLGSAVAAVLGLGLAWWTAGSRTPDARAGEVIILVNTEPGLLSLRDILQDDSLSARLESQIADQPIWRIHSDERADTGEFTHFFDFAPRTRRTSRVMQLVVDSRQGEAGVFEPRSTEIRWRTMPPGRSAPLVAGEDGLARLRNVLSDPETLDALLSALRQDPPISISDVFLPPDPAGDQPEAGDAAKLTIGERIIAYFTFIDSSGRERTPLILVETSGGETRLVVPDWLEALM